MTRTLLDILHSTACHCDHGLQFHSRNNWIQNQNSQSSYFHWKPIRRVLLLGRDCEPNFYFFNKMPQKIKIGNFPQIYKKTFPFITLTDGFPTRIGSFVTNNSSGESIKRYFIHCAWCCTVSFCYVFEIHHSTLN